MTRAEHPGIDAVVDAVTNSKLMVPVAAMGTCALNVTGVPIFWGANGVAVSNTEEVGSDVAEFTVIVVGALVPPALVAVTLKVMVTPTGMFGTVHEGFEEPVIADAAIVQVGPVTLEP